MPRRSQLANGEIYHIVLRGIEGKIIFKGEADYYRAIHNLFEFNDESPASWHYRYYYNNHEARPRGIKNDRKEKKKRKLLIEILAFCLMPNHVHLLLRQIIDNGITKFMRKFGTGYVVYFNKKYERQGYLFQGRFKTVHIKTDEQLKNVFIYIHTNSASLIDPKWKESEIKNPDNIIKEIENYKWSSYGDYLEKGYFPSVTQRDSLNQIIPKDSWQNFVNDWVRFKANDLNDVALE